MLVRICRKRCAINSKDFCLQSGVVEIRLYCLLLVSFRTVNLVNGYNLDMKTHQLTHALKPDDLNGVHMNF